jgi:release factor glutamine methyltransferase
MLHGFYRTCRRFEDAGMADPLNETLRLLDIVSNGAVRRMNGDFLAGYGTDLQGLLAKRKEGVPLEYALGRTTFMGLQFTCTPACLIPREETELLARTALKLLDELSGKTGEPLVIDMCTGSGNLAVSLAVHAPNIRVMASDISEEAIEVARCHASQHGVESRVSMLSGDMFAPLEATGCKGSVDMVVCNPPYIPTSSLAKMAPEVIGHEPVVAFAAGAYGIDIFRRLIADAPEYLKPGGVLVFEFGEGQEKLVERLVDRSGRYGNIRCHVDPEGKPRVLSASTKQ